MPRDGDTADQPTQAEETVMVEREEMAVEVLTALGWYRGHITVPAGGRLLDFLNTKPEMIAMTRAVEPGGTSVPFIVINTDQVLAIRPQATV
jgi:hypothetical protein